MALSNQTYQNLAKALADEVVEYIFESNDYVNFMLEIIPEAIENKLGKVDLDVLKELSFCIMDRIHIQKAK